MFRRFSTRPVVTARQVFTPSLRTSLSLLCSTVVGVSAYTTYQVAYNRTSVFIPYWLSPKHRKPLKSDPLDRQAFVEEISLRLQDRLAVDEEVHKLLGTPIQCRTEGYQWQVTIKSSEPGIKGVSISPDPLRMSVETRPFAASSGIDRVMLPFQPGDADSEDAMAKPNERQNHHSEVWVAGTVAVVGKYGKHKRAEVQFHAVKSLDHPKSTPKFLGGTLVVYEDEGSDKVKMSRRLW